MQRSEQLHRLQNESFDLLIIGGGATGVGCALDAATRGLSVALVEADDFSSGTSSRSTKLIHGGVRYLEQAVKNLDRSQFNLVRDALRERSILIKLAPHLAEPIALLTPLYQVYQLPYFMTGLKLYDRLAGKSNLAPSYFVTRKQALARFPQLKPKGLRGGVVYHDGQFDDARMNVSIAMTAHEHGAVMANHVRVEQLMKEAGRCCGAQLRDELTGARWSVNAKQVINATGPFCDHIRKLDDPDCSTMLSASSGVHIVLDKTFSPPQLGMLIPETDDGRVLFVLPWLGHTLVGTTDNPATIEAHPKAQGDDIDYLLEHVSEYFKAPITRNDVKATFSGLRPLVSDLTSLETAKLSRDHVVQISESGLVTIAGGKWTTYRKMAEDAVNQAIKTGGLEPKQSSQTARTFIAGGKDYCPLATTELIEDYDIDDDCADYFNRAYGDRAPKVLDIAKQGYKTYLADGHEYLEAEVIYACRFEGACTIVDVLARRLRLSFLDHQATLGCIEKTADLMAGELSWTQMTRTNQIQKARNYFA